MCRNIIAGCFQELLILSYAHAANNSERSQDQELLTHFLGNLGTLANSLDPSDLSRLLRAAQDPPKLVTTAGTSSEAIITSVPNGVPEQDSRRPLGSAAKMTCTPGVQGPPQETDHIPSVAEVPKIGRESSEGEASRAVPHLHILHSKYL